MTTFHLPDLGEGLPDAEINEWHVQVGDSVTTDQPLVSMETAKAVVEVPSPYEGVIVECCGTIGQVIKTGAPLVRFKTAQPNTHDQGTVVGELAQAATVSDETFIIGSPTVTTDLKRINALPKVRQFAEQKGIDLNEVTATGPRGRITQADIEAYLNQLPAGYEPLKGVRRQMAVNIQRAQHNVALVTVFEDANIDHWPSGEDITVRLIQAICQACQQEPALNAWYDSARQARRCFERVNLGLATDTVDGLFVPVMTNACQQTASQLRHNIDRLKNAVSTRSIDPSTLNNASFTLSNFGRFAGRYATPMVLPPTVAILAVGRRRGSPNCLPLSLSFDHRAVTGGEATRFVGVLVEQLQQAYQHDCQPQLVARTLHQSR